VEFETRITVNFTLPEHWWLAVLISLVVWFCFC